MASRTLLFTTLFGALLIIVAVITSGLAFSYYNNPPPAIHTPPPPPQSSTPSTTTAPDDTSEEAEQQTLKTGRYTFGGLRENFTQMERDGVIRSAPFALFLAQVLGYDKRIQKGIYKFSNQLSTLQILELLIKGEEESVLFTVVEGYDLYDIDQSLFKQSLIPVKGDFIAYAHAAKILQTVEKMLNFPPELQSSLVSTEGFLYPNSYQIRLSYAKEDLTRLALTQFQTTVMPVLIANVPPENWLAIMKISSLVEKETFLVSEKPLISSVIYNRIKRNMKLRYDPTIIYALKKSGDYDDHLTETGVFDIKKEHFTFSSPYNTYTIKGLPKTPISSFSLTSLTAALKPAQSDYLFFVARSRTDLSQGHDFSQTYEEHLYKIEQYQR